LLPPLAEQTAIAAFLDRETGKIDDLVAEQRRLMELLKEKRQAVISHAVTKGVNPHAKMKPSGIEWLGDVPEGWVVTKLGRAVFMQEGPGLRNWQFTNEGTRVICVTNITESGIDFARLEKFISIEEYKETYMHFTVKKGDVLLSSSGNSWGKVAIYDGDEEVILNTSTIRLNQTLTAPLDRTYIALLLQSDQVREQLRLAMTGSCQPNFGPSHLNSVMVLVPSSREQIEIIAFVQSVTVQLDTFTAEAQRAIDLLQERRTALISAAVTGQIDVRQQARN
jgi:type I restriction enzyme S subunit